MQWLNQLSDTAEFTTETAEVFAPGDDLPHYLIKLHGLIWETGPHYTIGSAVGTNVKDIHSVPDVLLCQVRQGGGNSSQVVMDYEEVISRPMERLIDNMGQLFTLIDLVQPTPSATLGNGQGKKQKPTWRGDINPEVLHFLNLLDPNVYSYELLDIGTEVVYTIRKQDKVLGRITVATGGIGSNQAPTDDPDLDREWYNLAFVMIPQVLDSRFGRDVWRQVGEKSATPDAPTPPASNGHGTVASIIPRKREKVYMKKSLTFYQPSRLTFLSDTIGWSFPFNMVDSSLIGTPEENCRTTAYHVEVSATHELVIRWGFYFATTDGVDAQSENEGHNLMKVLFERGRRYVVKKLRDTGELAQKEVLRLDTSSPEARDRFDPSRIQDPVGMTFEVDAAVNTSQNRMADEKPPGGVSIGNVTGGITGSIIAGGNVTIGGASPHPDKALVPVEASPTEKLAKLHQNIAAFFGDEELRSLCFDLGVDYADLPAQGKDGKVRELVAYMERRSRIPELVGMCRKLRPNVEW